MLIIKTLHVRILLPKNLRWILIMEEYGPDIENIKGDNNIVADTLSRFP